MPIGSFPEVLSQQILIETVLVGRLGVWSRVKLLALRIGRRAAPDHDGRDRDRGDLTREDRERRWHWSPYGLIDAERLALAKQNMLIADVWSAWF